MAQLQSMGESRTSPTPVARMKGCCFHCPPHFVCLFPNLCIFVANIHHFKCKSPSFSVQKSSALAQKSAHQIDSADESLDIFRLFVPPFILVGLCRTLALIMQDFVTYRSARAKAKTICKMLISNTRKIGKWTVKS